MLMLYGSLEWDKILRFNNNQKNRQRYRDCSWLGTCQYNSGNDCFNRYTREKKVRRRTVYPFRGHFAPRLFLHRFSFFEINSSARIRMALKATHSPVSVKRNYWRENLMHKFFLWKKLNHLLKFIQYSADTKTVVPIGNELIAGNRRTLLEIIDELQMDDFVAQVIFYVTQNWLISKFWPHLTL